MGFLKKLQLTPPVLLALLAGLLLFISGTTGAASWESMGEIAKESVADNVYVIWLFKLLVFIGSLGGLAVMAGGLLIGTERVTRGRTMISIGVGTGLFGLIMLLLSWYEEQPEVVTYGFVLGVIGITLSVIARTWAKKIQDREKD